MLYVILLYLKGCYEQLSLHLLSSKELVDIYVVTEMDYIAEKNTAVVFSNK